MSPKSSPLDYGEGTLSLWSVGRHCEACFFVYSVGDRASFEAVRWYHEQFLLERSIERKNPRCWYGCDSGVPTYCPPRPPFDGLIFVMANKIDGERVVTKEEGEQLSESLGATYMEISARMGDGVGTELLKRLVSRILLHRITENEVVSQVNEDELGDGSSSAEAPEARPSMGKTFVSRVAMALSFKSIRNSLRRPWASSD